MMSNMGLSAIQFFVTFGSRFVKGTQVAGAARSSRRLALVSETLSDYLVLLLVCDPNRTKYVL